jgi:hypothetical protein
MLHSKPRLPSYRSPKFCHCRGRKLWQSAVEIGFYIPTSSTDLK